MSFKLPIFTSFYLFLPNFTQHKRIKVWYNYNREKCRGAISLVGVALLLGSKHLQELFDFFILFFWQKASCQILTPGR